MEVNPLSLRQIFDNFDIDNDGILSRDEAGAPSNSIFKDFYRSEKMEFDTFASYNEEAYNKYLDELKNPKPKEAVPEPKLDKNNKKYTNATKPAKTEFAEKFEKLEEQYNSKIAELDAKNLSPEDYVLEKEEIERSLILLIQDVSRYTGSPFTPDDTLRPFEELMGVLREKYENQ